MLVFAWLCVALGVSFGSSVLPLASIEIFLVGLAMQEPHIPWLALGAAVAVGQVGGKLVHYYAACGQLHLPHWIHRRHAHRRPATARRVRWQIRTKRIRKWVEVLREKCHQHPRWMVATYGISALVGLPPYTATAVLAGMARMNLSVFLSAGLIGRFIRFSAIAAVPAWCANWIR
jgi:membrane protein YqaA with SNARE-associated domain